MNRIGNNLFLLGLPLIGTILRVLQYHREGKHDSASKEDTSDEQLQALAEITAEFLADICIQIPKVKPKEPFFILRPPNPVFLMDQIAKEVSNHSVFVFFCFFLFVFFLLFVGHCGRFGGKRLPYREDFSHSCKQFNAEL